MTKEYLDALSQLNLAKAKLEEERINMQLNCKHENLAEVPYTTNFLGYHTASYRICADCGFAESGWGCGHQILVKEPNITKDNVIGEIWQNHTFVVSIPWQRTGKAPKDKQEAYEMAVKGTLPKEYKERYET